MFFSTITFVMHDFSYVGFPHPSLLTLSPSL